MSIHFTDHPKYATLAVGGTNIVLEKEGHFTSSNTDFLVNPAQPKLTGGGGLDKVIHDAAGSALKNACKNIPYAYGKVRCPTGEARLTHAANLPQAYVIHTVGPKISGKVSKADSQKLWNSYHNCLAMAENFCEHLKNPGKKHPLWMDKIHSSKEGALKHKLTAGSASITFCCISTGSYSYPADKAAKIAIKAMVDFAQHHPNVVRDIHISCAKNQKDIPHLVSVMKSIH
jgi:O-acetyl-ADP-ribose deacetylase (regulator of RNase III)